MQKSAKSFIIVVAIAAVAVIAAMVASLGWGQTAPASEAFALLALVLAAEFLQDSLPAGGKASVAFVPLVSALMVSPTVQTVLAGVAITAVTHAVRRRGPAKVLFNGAQAALGLSVSLAAFLTLGGKPFAGIVGASGVDALREFVFPSVALTAVLVLMNTALVSTIVALTTDKRPVEVWKANTLLTVNHLIVAVPATFGIAWIAITSDVIGVAVLCVPLLGIRGLYKTTYDLQQVNEELLELMIKAIEARDPYTSGHSRRVSATSRTIAQALELPPQQVDRVAVAALLHDVGKIHEAFAPILSKPGRLTEAEWEVMKTHPGLGAELVATISHLRHAVPAVRGHHENWDGTGYPDGLAGEKIPLGARIITVADTIDALTTDRPYRTALGPAEVRAELVRCRGAQFDPAVCDVVLSADVWMKLFPESAIVGRESTLRLGRRARTAAVATQ
jgi:hypothetical protein